jgi:large subunit ribosomal protein L24
VNVKVKIRKGDTVEVITGKEADKGKRAEVMRVLHKNRRLVVQGVNIRKKHQRAQQQGGRQINPGIIEFEGTLAISNVMLVCPNCSKPARVGVRRDDKGVAHRVCKNCSKDID